MLRFDAPVNAPSFRGDTMRMNADSTVALIFLRGRGDSAWAFKARKGTTTWNLLMWGDTLGKLVGAGMKIDRGPLGGTGSATLTLSNGAGTGYMLYDASGHIQIYGASAGNNVILGAGGGTARLYITASGDSGAAGAVAKRDTLKAMVVATTAMSHIVVPLGGTFSAGGLCTWVLNTNVFAGLYAVSTPKHLYALPPIPRYINGAKCIADSLIYWRQLLTATDTLLVDFGSIDSVGNVNRTIGYDTTKGTGSKALLRKARAFRPADTCAYNRTLFINFSNKTLSDTCFLFQLEYKYHTIP
jgi:hypothetical protein